MSLTAPWLGRYAIDKYLSRAAHPLLGDDATFEVRILTVEPRWRRSPAAALLMYAALRWISSRGGRSVVALGRGDLLSMYQHAGLRCLGPKVRSGRLTFELIGGAVDDLIRHALRRHGRTLRRLGPRVDWRLDTPWLPGPDGGFTEGLTNLPVRGSSAPSNWISSSSRYFGMSALLTRDVSSRMFAMLRCSSPGRCTRLIFTRYERVWTSSSASRFMPPSSRNELK